MQYLFYSFALALVIALICSPVIIPVLRRLKFGQNIRNDGPQSHLAKAGTPTMGGIIIIVALTIPSLFFAGSAPDIWLVLFVTLGYGFIGFLDDFIKIVLKRSLGLKAKQKILGQIMVAIGFIIFSGFCGKIDTSLWVPLWNIRLDLGALYYVFVFLVLVGTTNAVNLTDGLDGLAAGITVITALAYAVVCYFTANISLTIFSLAVAGACLGFLKFNSYPAKVFMGDTGSLALGGALAAISLLTKTELLLVIIGGIYVVEALSVIIQVTSFKTTGKRVFLMSPIHHHFELKGWSEKKVVTSFWLAAAICSLVAIMILRLA